MPWRPLTAAFVGAILGLIFFYYVTLPVLRSLW
jgi:hypothetical protein